MEICILEGTSQIVHRDMGNIIGRMVRIIVVSFYVACDMEEVHGLC